MSTADGQAPGHAPTGTSADQAPERAALRSRPEVTFDLYTGAPPDASVGIAKRGTGR